MTTEKPEWVKNREWLLDERAMWCNAKSKSVECTGWHKIPNPFSQETLERDGAPPIQPLAPALNKAVTAARKSA